MKLFKLYAQRAKAGIDRTEYVATDSSARGAHAFAPHWAQLLSAAVVEGDAARSLRAVDKARSEAVRRAPAPPPAPRAASRVAPALPSPRPTALVTPRRKRSDPLCTERT